MSNSFRSFEELECWKACRDVKKFIRGLTKLLPRDERYDLVDNMRRASRISIRNIAEGFGRYHYQENIQFCRISRGSLFELWDDLITCLDDKYISNQEYVEGIGLIQKGIRILNGYIKYLETAKAREIKH